MNKDRTISQLTRLKGISKTPVSGTLGASNIRKVILDDKFGVVNSINFSLPKRSRIDTAPMPKVAFSEMTAPRRPS